ncbi:MAG: hypothetical protein A2156_05120 [Deltaproteobacteria bacterium RBG_16_48_10]|nr:MAG: hypothetical protein A2156_05120 [Deltaproteobacteria bacterium RBG_16_48_10]
MRISSYNFSVTSKIVYPLVTLIFATAYYLEARHLSSAALLFAKSLIYLSWIFGLYCLLKEGLKIEKIKYAGQEKRVHLEEMPATIYKRNRSLWLAVSILCYLILFGYIGFIITSLLFMVITMFLLGVRKILLLTVVPLSVVGFVYFLFSWWLLVPLPQGIFKFLP